ncbi:MAG: hypothetical protein WD066_14060 [Planctomycetaceae bacterium]
MLTVSGKAIGRKRPLFSDFSVPFPCDPGDGGVTLRDLIERVVRAEIEAFRTRQQERQLIRVLTKAQIADAAEAGKIEMGGSEVEPQEVDEDAAVAAALAAFEDGLYLVAIDGREHRELDEQVFVREDSRVTFIRLTLLAGG